MMIHERGWRKDNDDLIPSFVEGCRVNGEIYVVPQLLCTVLLYTRKKDVDLKNVDSINDLFGALDEPGLMLDKHSASIVYLQALTDCEQHYMEQYPPIETETLSSEAVASLEKIRDMHLIDPDGDPKSPNRFYNAQKFAEGMGRAYIGYSEAMGMMGESASEMDFRLFSMSDNENIPVFYVDASAVNAKISDEKKALALDLLNMITGKETLVKASANNGDPGYLLVPRYSVYDALASDYPIYKGLKKAALVPDSHVFRIKPDGDAYLEEAKNREDLLPSFTK